MRLPSSVALQLYAATSPVGRRRVRDLRLVTFHVMNGACFFCTFLIPILEIGIIVQYLISNDFCGHRGIL